MEFVVSRPDISSLLIILVVLTTIVTSNTGLKRGEIDSLVGSKVGCSVFGWLILLGLITLQVLCIYLVLILVLLSLLKIVILDLELNVLSIINLFTVGLEPASKLAVVMALGDNVGDWLNARKLFSFRRYLLVFFGFLVPVYYAGQWAAQRIK